MRMFKLIPLVALISLSVFPLNAFSAQNESLGFRNLRETQNFEWQFNYQTEIPGKCVPNELEVQDFGFIQSKNSLQDDQTSEIGNVSGNLSINLNALKGNRQHVAEYLNSQASDLLGSSFAILTELTGDDLDNALDTINPARNSFATFAIQNVGFSLGSIVSSRLFDQRSLKDPLFSPITIGKNKSSQDLICSADDKYQSSFLEVDSADKVKGGIRSQSQENSFNIWGMGLGDFAKQMDQNQTPSFDLDSSFATLGLDWGNLTQGVLGACVAYVHSKIQGSRSFGHEQINSVYGGIYGLTYVGDFFFNAQVWGGYQYINSLRKIYFSNESFSPKSDHVSASFNPHLGGGYDFYLGSKKQFTVEPFVDLDWVNVFENGYQEKGSSYYNMKFSDSYSSMLQMETGLNGYWNGKFETGNLIVKGALSYILKAPFGTGSVNSTLVGGVGSLKVETFTDTQNIASPSAELFWQDENNAFASIGYKGEFSYVYISNQVLGKLGYNF